MKHNQLMLLAVTLAAVYILCLLPATICAQGINLEKRLLPVLVLDKKGRPMKNIALESSQTGLKGQTDPTGQYIFENLPANDVISVNLPKYGKADIPVAGMDSIVLKQRATYRYVYINKENQTVTIEKDNTKSNIVLDVPEILKKQSHTSLIDLLRGRVAGLNFTQTATGQTTATIRGSSSFDTDNEPLVALDGIIIGTVNEANAFVNIHDIKTIEILKVATEWGVRGSNGVIVITTKRN